MFGAGIFFFDFYKVMYPSNSLKIKIRSIYCTKATSLIYLDPFKLFPFSFPFNS